MLKSIYIDACRLCLKSSYLSLIYIFDENLRIPYLLERFVHLKIIKEEEIESFLSQKICVSCYEKLIQMDDFRKLCIRSDIFLKQEIGLFDNNTETELIQFSSTSSIKSVPIIKPTTTSIIDVQQIFNNSNSKIKNKDSNLKVYVNKRLQGNKTIETKNSIRNNVEIESTEIPSITILKNELINHKLSNVSNDNKMLEEENHDSQESIIEILSNENNIGDKTYKNVNTINLLLVNETEIKCKETGQEQQNESRDNQKTILLNIDKISGKHKSKKIVTAKKTLKAKTNTKNKKSANLMPCHICGKFTEPSKYKYHLNMHNDIRPFVCTYENCKSAFTSPFHLKSHHKFSHTDFAPYKCEICGKSFKVQTTYKVHKSYHGDPQIPCKICGKLLRNYRVVKKHMMSHTGERPYPCNVCTKSFQNRYNLNVHKRVHTKERPFICCRCGEAFGYNSLLKGHMEKMHTSDEN